MNENQQPLYDVVQIRKLLPHRYPFLLVDRVEKVERPANPKNRVGFKIWATKCVTYNEEFFQGHFPHKPVMPAVLQVESMAQAAALSLTTPEEGPIDVLVASVTDSRFRQSVVPGDVLNLYSEVLKEKAGFITVKCHAEVRGKVVVEAEIVAKVFKLQES